MNFIVRHKHTKQIIAKIFNKTSTKIKERAKEKVQFEDKVDNQTLSLAA